MGGWKKKNRESNAGMERTQPGLWDVRKVRNDKMLGGR